MDKVVFRQTHFKRVLEKQLDEIEVNQRQSEARRLKQIRDLGVDLTRIQRTSRDLEFTDDLDSRRNNQRRVSLPALDSGGDISIYLESSKGPRSRRRLSCSAAIPMASPDIKDFSENAYSKIGKPVSEKDSPFLPIKAGPEGNNPAPVSTTQGQGGINKNEGVINIPTIKSTKPLPKRRNSLDSAEIDLTQLALRGDSDDNGGVKNGNNAGHNVTTVYVHDDSGAATPDEVSSDDEASDADLQSMFQLARNRGRRASEPAVGGYFIRRLQAADVNEMLAFQQRNNLDSEELKRSIQKNLPSHFVAEKDEEERDADELSESTDDVSELPSGLQISIPLSSIWENDQDGVHQKDICGSKPMKGDAASKEKNKSSKRNPNLIVPRQRRSSDGDVLSYSMARKFHFQEKNQAWKSSGSGRASTATASNKHSNDGGDGGQKGIWQSVRQCRYLRGYDPPEMNEPKDVTQFVFGHAKSDSRPPNSK